MSNPATIPAEPAAFRKWIKTATREEMKALSQEQLQAVYDRAKEAYPAKGGKPLSRAERVNLYLIQSRLFGSVDAKLVTSLEKIGETLVKKTVDYQLPADGAVIIKHWKGKKLEIKIVPSGFEYDGRIYQSLSALAKHIAGYGVSGPIIFGLRKPKMPTKVAA